MDSTNTLCKKLLNVKGCVVEGCEFYVDTGNINHIRIKARPNKHHMNDCPYCHRHCQGYDSKTKSPRIWRGLDWGGTLVEIEYKTHRVLCPEHGVVVADVPWAFPNSSFTKDFDMTVGWLAVYLPRSTISELMRIDWETVGRCVHRTLAVIEPERSKRLDNLVKIGIDETSYRKGHKYITVVVNHENNTVVWAAQGFGKTVLESFFKQLSTEQCNSIKVVTGDGAKWITECVEKYLPNAERCDDPFHVDEWANEAVDVVRRESWREAYDDVKRLKKENPHGKGRPKKNDTEADDVLKAKKNASAIKNSAYTLGKAEENLTEKQHERLAVIAETNPKLFRAYRLKEKLRLILKIKDVELAETELKHWLWWASHSRIPAFKELYLKINRHKKYILNAIRQGMSNARIEAINNKIKLVIRKAYGFRNIQNMLDMVYLVCSNLTIPLPNRKSNIALTAQPLAL